jgi:hypothetical protein
MCVTELASVSDNVDCSHAGHVITDVSTKSISRVTGRCLLCAAVCALQHSSAAISSLHHSITAFLLYLRLADADADAAAAAAAAATALVGNAHTGTVALYRQHSAALSTSTTVGSWC